MEPNTNQIDWPKLLLRAEQIAHEAHAGVKRTLPGHEEDYVNHPRRVAYALRDFIFLAMAGWLHDVVEDNYEWPLARLRAEFTEEVVELVEAVTRRKGESYKEFILRIKAHSQGAIDLKKADIHDNLRDLPLNDTRRTRYLEALEVLNS